MEEKKRSLEQRNSILLGTIVFLLFIIFLTLAWYIFDVARGESQNNLANSEAVSADASVFENSEETLQLSNKDPEVGGIVEKVSKHMLLPTGEVTVAIVKDAYTLRQQNPEVFKYVKNGDRLLLYQGGVIVYDLAVDKIVDAVRIIK